MGYTAKLLLIAQIEILREHRQEFVHSEGLLSLPLLPDVARLFEGQVACSLVTFYAYAHPADRLSVRTSATAMLSFSSCMSCKSDFHKCALSHPFRPSGKLSVSPDQATFNVREEFRRLV